MKWDDATIARAESLREAGVDRHAVAKRMSALLGEPVSPSAVENRVRERGSRAQNKPKTGCERPQRANGRPGWTQEMIAYLRHAWNVEGLKQREIAERMSAKFRTRITRNGVGGMIDRLRYAGMEFKPRSRKPPPPPKRAAVVNGGAVMASIKAKRRMERKPPTPIVETENVTTQDVISPISAENGSKNITTHVTLLAAKPCHCRWPISDVSADMLVCGAEVEQPGKPYCPEHRKRAWREPRR